MKNLIKINEKAKKIEKNALMLYLINSLMKCASETQEVKYFLWFTIIFTLSR